jgi:hypothetical protein
MPQKHTNDQYFFDFYPNLDIFGNPQPVPLDFSRKPYCECGEEFLVKIREQFETVLDSPTIRGLDEAILTLSIEYAERLKSLPEHPLNSCVPEVFNEVLSLLTEKRNELLRHPNRANTAHVPVGVQKVQSTSE